MLWLVMPASGSCQSLPPFTSGGSVAIIETISIKKPVGVGPLARNLKEDVETIQDALNQVTVKGDKGGPMPFLKVDGIHGPKTQAAINKFQQVQLQILDGVIEPNRKTMQRLNEIIAPVSDEDLKKKVALTLPIVSQMIVAALGNLQAIITNGPAQTGPAAVAADRLNRHFRLNTLSQNAQSLARVDLFRTYTRFAAVMVDPTAVNIDPSN